MDSRPRASALYNGAILRGAFVEAWKDKKYKTGRGIAEANSHPYLLNVLTIRIRNSQHVRENGQVDLKVDLDFIRLVYKADALGLLSAKVVTSYQHQRKMWIANLLEFSVRSDVPMESSQGSTRQVACKVVRQIL